MSKTELLIDAIRKQFAVWYIDLQLAWNSVKIFWYS